MMIFREKVEAEVEVDAEVESRPTPPDHLSSEKTRHSGRREESPSSLPDANDFFQISLSGMVAMPDFTAHYQSK